MMRLRCALLLLLPAVLPGAASEVAVHVTARVPLVAAVDGPAQVVLAPGEVGRIQVSVEANVPWVLDVHSANTAAPVSVTFSGPPGGANANRREVSVGCSPQAQGPQTIVLVYSLMPR